MQPPLHFMSFPSICRHPGPSLSLIILQSLLQGVLGNVASCFLASRWGTTLQREWNEDEASAVATGRESSEVLTQHFLGSILAGRTELERPEIFRKLSKYCYII